MPVPPSRVRKAAQTARDERQIWIDSGVKNLPTTKVGLARMNQLIRGDDLSLDTIQRMYSYFQRHQFDNISWQRDSKGRLSKGMVSWLAWGGDSGWRWSERQLEKAGLL